MFSSNLSLYIYIIEILIKSRLTKQVVVYNLTPDLKRESPLTSDATVCCPENSYSALHGTISFTTVPERLVVTVTSH